MLGRHQRYKYDRIDSLESQIEDLKSEGDSLRDQVKLLENKIEIARSDKEY